MMLLAVGATVLAGIVGVRLLYPWLWVDIKYLFTLLRHGLKYVNKHKLLVDFFEDNVKANPDKVMLIFQGQSYTYKEGNEKANKVARAAQSLDLKQGDAIALLMYNSPDFLWINLGLMKIGVIPSLINTSLRGKQLLHCITASEPQLIIVGEDADLNKALMDIQSELTCKIYMQCSADIKVPSDFECFADIVEKMLGDQNIDRACRKAVEADDCCCYIFTSGTTGLPKPAIVIHKRVLMGNVIGLSFGARKHDIWYVCLPLFHSNGLILGAYASIGIGATIVLAKKFSKTNLLVDCRRHNVTVINYIGEFFRFLLTNEKSERDSEHSIRLAIGNGLRQDIYRETVDRFKIANMGELYAATEGSIGFMNVFNKVGACGRASPFLRKLLKCGLYKYDPEEECLVRDDMGHCIPVETGEPGLLLAAINKLQKFDGYKGKKELTQSKVLRNVVKDGDVYFNTGDLMTLDAEHFLYFNDRIGDTYRWKGENVSTTEVSNLLTEVDFVVDACVYGVSIPGQDGKAGMVSLLLSADKTTVDDATLETLSEFCNRTFPVYSRPVFVRFRWGNLDMTVTIKQSKIMLKQEGYDVNRVADPLYFYDKSTSKYVKLDKMVYSRIESKSIMF